MPFIFMLDHSAGHHVRSVPIQEILCPLWNKAERKGVEVGVMDCPVCLSYGRSQFMPCYKPLIKNLILNIP